MATCKTQMGVQMKNNMKAVLTSLIKKEIAQGHDIQTATANILKTEGSNFKRSTIRAYYKTFTRSSG